MANPLICKSVADKNPHQRQRIGKEARGGMGVLKRLLIGDPLATRPWGTPVSFSLTWDEEWLLEIQAIRQCLPWLLMAGHSNPSEEFSTVQQ
jgi:hypothetical protein